MASPDKAQILKQVVVEVVSDSYPEIVARKCEMAIQSHLNEPNCEFTLDIKSVPYTINEYGNLVTAFNYVGTVTCTFNVRK